MLLSQQPEGVKARDCIDNMDFDRYVRDVPVDQRYRKQSSPQNLTAAQKNILQQQCPTAKQNR
jgi:hypothetical protein